MRSNLNAKFSNNNNNNYYYYYDLLILIPILILARQSKETAQLSTWFEPVPFRVTIHSTAGELPSYATALPIVY